MTERVDAAAMINVNAGRREFGKNEKVIKDRPAMIDAGVKRAESRMCRVIVSTLSLDLD